MIKLSKEKVLLLHQLIAEETGGSVGIRKSEAKRVLGRQCHKSTPWLTERHGYDPTCF